jgi:hypothetical protein
MDTDGFDRHHSFKTISIFAGVSKTLVSERLRNGKVTGCGKTVPALTQQKIDATPRIVAQMGPEHRVCRLCLPNIFEEHVRPNNDASLGRICTHGQNTGVWWAVRRAKVQWCHGDCVSKQIV